MSSLIRLPFCNFVGYALLTWTGEPFAPVCVVPETQFAQLFRGTSWVRPRLLGAVTAYCQALPCPKVVKGYTACAGVTHRTSLSTFSVIQKNP